MSYISNHCLSIGFELIITHGNRCVLQCCAHVWITLETGCRAPLLSPLSPISKYIYITSLLKVQVQQDSLEMKFCLRQSDTEISAAHFVFKWLILLNKTQFCSEIILILPGAFVLRRKYCAHSLWTARVYCQPPMTQRTQWQIFISMSLLCCYWFHNVTPMATNKTGLLWLLLQTKSMSNHLLYSQVIGHDMQEIIQWLYIFVYKYRTDRKLFSSMCFQAVTKVKETVTGVFLSPDLSCVGCG